MKKYISTVQTALHCLNSSMYADIYCIMYILREGYNAIGTSIVTAHCILEMLSIYQFLSS